MDAFPLRQQLGQMGVVDASVPGAGQVHHVGGEPLGRGVGRSATAVAVSQSRRAALTVGRQDPPGVARGHSHQLGGLVQGNAALHRIVVV